MRPPHIAPAIAFSPARLLGALVLLALVVTLAVVIAWRRGRAGVEGVDAPLKRLNGFHIFGPDDDEEPVVHVPVLRARPAVPGSPAALRRAQSPNGTAPASSARPARMPLPAAHRGAAASGSVRSQATAATAAAAAVPVSGRAASPRAGTPTATPRPRPAGAKSSAVAAKPAAAPKPAAAAPKPTATARPRRTATEPSLSWNTPSPARAAADPAPTLERELSGSPSRPPNPAPEPRDDLPGDGDILLVEDDVTIATMYQMLLSAKGYATRHAQDGVEGIAMVRDERPALILLDMMMPRMDGIQFLEALRGWPRTRSIPVVVLSNVGDRHLVERALDLGAVEYLVKAQTRPQVLVGALPHWLRGNRALTTLS
jgi:CheY-like chemotaxis protein